MTPFRVVEGPVVALLRPNVDTDVIIRIEHLMPELHDKLAHNAFAALRYLPDGSPDPDCPFNAKKYRGAPFLITGPNFGSGSSREGAVWALTALGIRCVIGSSFGDIFFNNCFENGVLAIVFDDARVHALARLAARGGSISVDLEQRVLHGLDTSPLGFEVDPLQRTLLLAGLDSIGLTLQDEAAIEAWQQRDREARPWIWQHGATL